MNKQLYLAIGLTNGLKCYVPYVYGPDLSEIYDIEGMINDYLYTSAMEEDDMPLHLREFGLVVRPLSDLTKPIVQANYNNGEPFVPNDEIEKIFGGRLYMANGLRMENEYAEAYSVNEAMDIIQLLLSWHFWPNMPENEQVVYVTDEFNPYR